jgi:two-component system cell cycle response regulator CtrA
MRVLLIEDDSATARSIELMLRSEGLNVYTTGLRGEGVDLSKLYDYDIIVLDLSLPDMSAASAPGKQGEDTDTRTFRALGD